MYFADALVSTGMSVMFYLIVRFFFTRFVTKEPFDIFTMRDLTATGFFALIVFSINYFWVDSAQQIVEKKNVTQTVASGQSFTAPEMEAVQKPLQIELNLESQSDEASVQTEVVTDLARYVFSSHGAALQSMDILWQEGKVNVPLVQSQIPSCIIGLTDQTPTHYELIRSTESAELQAHVLEYQARVKGTTIHKAFVVYKNKYQIDVKIGVDGSGLNGEQVRLFITSPVLSEEIKAVVNKPSSASSLKVQDIVLTKPNSFNEFWFEPKMFGFTTKFLTTVCFAATPGALGRAYLKKISDTQFQGVLESKALVPGQEIGWSLYVGPRAVNALAAVAPDLDNLMQYGWLTPLAKPALKFMLYLHEKTGSYGIVIILLALLIKLILLPFTLKSERSMKQQAEFEKKRAHLQQKFKHDKAALDEATAELINKYGFPMLSGCLPMLLNIPVFLALNKVLSSAIELHGASFLWLPDLSATDPYYILSLMVFVAMVASPVATVDPRQWFSRIGFALFLAAVTAYLASGLALFIMMNTVLGVVQTFVIRNIRWFGQ